ncbi:hypothetical protein ACW9YQ_25115 (plasmid) [Paraburkholderia strydomiana]
MSDLSSTHHHDGKNPWWIMQIPSRRESRRKIVMTACSMAALLRYRVASSAGIDFEGQDSPVLLPVNGQGSRTQFLTETTIYNIVKSAFQRAKEALEEVSPEIISHLEAASPHSLREAFIVDAIASGMKPPQIVAQCGMNNFYAIPEDE